MKKENKRGLLKKSKVRREALSRADISLNEGNACLESAEKMSKYAEDSESKNERNKFLSRAKSYHKKADSYINAAKKYERVGSGEGAFKIGNLKKTASALTAIIGILIGFFILAPQINGAVIGVVNSSQSFLGVIALFIGFIGMYLFFKKK
ncbi:MAG: hypothetical protein WC584_00340 [Candidatus Pacearchaeota archaeon]